MTRAIIWCAVSTGAQAEDEKVSLPSQEKDGRALCEASGWEIVDTLRVPGHSRSYIDFHELAAAASKEGIEAFNKLTQHWERRDFDVLILRDGERLARTQSLMAYIVEKTIAMGAKLYSLADGWVDEQNFRMWISMAGYKASGDVDRLVKGRKRGMADLARRGLPVSPKVPLSHKLIRDEVTGKAQRLEVNEEKRRLWNDLAELILEGVAWKKIENELFTRFGHVDQTGQPYKMYTMYVLVTNPMFWGHTAQGFRRRKSDITRHSGMWIFDESEPVPAGVTVYRNTVQSVYTGDLAERVKAELRRRQSSVRGKTDPNKTHRYTGLFVCGECGSGMGTYSRYQRRGKPISQLGLRCNMMYQKNRNELVCHQKGYVPYREIEAYLDVRLRNLLDGMTADVFESTDHAGLDAQKRVDAAQAELVDLETRIGKLIYELSAAGEDVQEYIRKQLSDFGKQASELRIQVAELRRKAALATQQSVIQTATIAEIREMTLDAFWQQPDRYINQMLHRLFGNRQLVILDKEIIGHTDRRRRRRRTNRRDA